MIKVTYIEGNNRNIPFIPQIFPFTTSAGVRGNKGNNLFRVIPYSPRRIAGPRT